jgi:queuine/archaeosine tRNA-ribosyltransferase
MKDIRNAIRQGIMEEFKAQFYEQRECEANGLNG